MFIKKCILTLKPLVFFKWTYTLLFSLHFHLEDGMSLIILQIILQVFTFQCSVICGRGVQSRNISCVIENNANLMVTAQDCSASSKPSAQKSCFKMCETRWVTGEWSEVNIAKEYSLYESRERTKLRT